MTSFATPTPQQIEAAVQRMRAPEFATYFLSRLNNPNWVKPLAEKGIFGSPPPPIAADDGRVSYPYWPASRYLVRMASEVPSEVAEILSQVQTDNVFVIGDVLDAARMMPVADAARLVPVVVGGRGLDLSGLHTKDASALCVHLVQGSQLSAALALASALFAPDQSSEDVLGHRHDNYWYKQGLDTVNEVLAGADPFRWLGTLCSWIETLSQAEHGKTSGDEDDGSCWWRPAVERHRQNSDFNVRSILTEFLRHGLELAIRSGHLALDDALGIVGNRTFLIFKRLRVHLVNEFADQVPDLARSIMMDREVFDDYRYKHEYARLLGRRFPLLSEDERTRWFSWVDAGPDLADWERSRSEELGREVTDQEREGRRHYWQFQRLHWLREHLEGDRRRFYDDMYATEGEPELADLNVQIRSGWGPGGSPFTVEELSALTFSQAVEKVASWKPAQDRIEGPSFEGLADAFSEYVATRPEEFSAEASTLVERPFRYVQKFIAQMTEGVKANREINVPAVLELCRWVVRTERPEATREQQELHDASSQWRWSRDEVASFVRALTDAKTDGEPRYSLDPYRKPMWETIDSLARDPAESYIVQDISKDDPRGHDYLTLAMNSPRGKAIEAALEYARWVANHTKEKDGDDDVIPGGFNSMPEVRDLLEWHSAPGNRTVHALAMIGSRLGLLYWIDREWLADNSSRLFDLESIERSPRASEGWAAWNAFLVWVRPHAEFYRLFKREFEFAVAQSAEVAGEAQSHERPMDHLAEHLMVLYGRGQLDDERATVLLRRFLESAHPDTRRHAFEFVGRVFESKEELPQDFVDRYRGLWDEYWAGAGKSDAEGKPDAWLFGMWFASGRFAPEWTLPRLEDYMTVAPVPEPDHLVLQTLVKLAPTNVESALRVLDTMIRADREGWRTRMWLDSARAILELGMKAGGETRQRTEQLIDHLGRRGFADLGELLRVASDPN